MTKTLRAQIVELLPDENKEHVNNYAVYCQSLLNAKDKQGNARNPWMKHNHPQKLAEAFQLVRSQGLVFDGKHITWQSTGISFDYVAYKNKMLLVYPESKIDVSVVYKADTFTVSKESGKVEYTHTIGDPFGSTEADIIGAYTVIKNERGEFLTTLNQAEIKKHRSVAKTDYIWQAWFKEMVMKTVIKKAVKYHFDDVFVEIEKQDNEQYDLEKVVTEKEEKMVEQIMEATERIGNCATVDELKEVWSALSGEMKTHCLEAKNAKKAELEK